MGRDIYPGIATFPAWKKQANKLWALFEQQEQGCRSSSSTGGFQIQRSGTPKIHLNDCPAIRNRPGNPNSAGQGLCSTRHMGMVW